MEKGGTNPPYQKNDQSIMTLLFIELYHISSKTQIKIKIYMSFQLIHITENLQQHIYVISTLTITNYTDFSYNI